MNFFLKIKKGAKWVEFIVGGCKVKLSQNNKDQKKIQSRLLGAT